MPECLVCGDHSDGQHFGIHACRACAAFFRRSTVSGKRFKCRFSNCCDIGKDVRCMCRACRLKKCRAMGMNANCVQRYRDGLGKRNSMNTVTQVDVVDSESVSPSSSTSTLSPEASSSNSSSFTDQPSCSSTAPVTWSLTPSSTPLLNQMLEGYHHLLKERSRVHCVITVPSGRRIYERNRVGMEASTRASAQLTIRADIPLIIEMLRTSFPPYFDFPSDQRCIYFRHFLAHFLTMEPCFRTAQRFPAKKDTRFLFQAEQLYYTTDDLYLYYSEDDHIDVEEAIRLFSPMFDMLLTNLKEPIVDNGMTEMEFVAILGLCLFAEGKEGASDKSVEMCGPIRQLLYKELFEVCKAQSNEEDVSVRFGTMIAFVPTIMKLGTRYVTKMTLAKLFGTIEYDAKVYALLPESI